MSQPLKLFLDECCSKRLVKIINGAYLEDYPELQTKHQSDFWNPGTKDSQWIPILAQEKDWDILTADRGKNSKLDKIQVICSHYKVTHISMTPALINAGFKHQKHALLTLWPQIMRVRFLPVGTRFNGIQNGE